MFGLGPKEIMIMAGILVSLFGLKKTTELSRNIGEATRQIRSEFSDIERRGTGENKISNAQDINTEETKPSAKMKQSTEEPAGTTEETT